MKINRNIWNKILDKMALNRWKICMKNINEQFHSLFSWDDNYAESLQYTMSTNDINCAVNICKNCCDNDRNKYHYSYYYWDDKPIYGDIYIWHYDITKCLSCKTNYNIHVKELNILHPDYRKK